MTSREGMANSASLLVSDDSLAFLGWGNLPGKTLQRAVQFLAGVATWVGTVSTGGIARTDFVTGIGVFEVESSAASDTSGLGTASVGMAALEFSFGEVVAVLAVELVTSACEPGCAIEDALSPSHGDSDWVLAADAVATAAGRPRPKTSQSPTLKNITTPSASVP